MVIFSAVYVQHCAGNAWQTMTQSQPLATFRRILSL